MMILLLSHNFLHNFFAQLIVVAKKKLSALGRNLIIVGPYSKESGFLPYPNYGSIMQGLGF
jgi:hypothetical protein